MPGARGLIGVLCVLGLCLPAVFSAAQGTAAGPDVRLSGVLETTAAHPGSTVRMAVVVTLGEGWHVNARKPLDDYLIPTVLEFHAADGVTVARTAYPEPVSLSLEGSTEPLAVYGEEFVIGLELAVAPEAAPGAYTLEGTLQYQACDAKRCLMPKTIPVKLPLEVVPADQPVTPQRPELFNTMRFDQTPAEAEPKPEPPGETAAAPAVPAPAAPAPAGPTDDWRSLADAFEVAGQASGYLNTREFLAFLDGAESGRADVTANPLAGRSGWFAMLFAIVGGFLLNLTPCVLPLIPINLAIIGAGAKAGSRTRGFLLGGAYGLGMALAYGALGVVVVLGLATAFGSLNASPWFNAAIAIVFAVLALAMFDVFLLDFTRFQARLGVSRGGRGGFALAFGMGAVAALLAGACVAPAIIATLVYAQDQYARGAPAALLLPFLIGVGMALPWPFAGAGLSFLPKPGKWMDVVRNGIGVVILLFAAYYGYLAVTLGANRWFVDREAVQASARMDAEGWLPSLENGLEQARREGKPVIVDLWATWCKSCLTMNKTTFKDPAVIQRLAPYVRVKHQAENLGDPRTRDVMERYGVLGLPTYVVLVPKSPGPAQPGA